MLPRVREAGPSVFPASGAHILHPSAKITCSATGRRCLLANAVTNIVEAIVLSRTAPLVLLN